MRVIIVEPGKVPEVVNIDDKLEAMQSIVGGLIECLYLDDEMVAIINEEGKLLRLTPNRILVDSAHRMRDVIMGTFFLCYAPADSEDFQSVPENLLKKYVSAFKAIEVCI